jgi:hypothetical protein
MLSCRLSVTRSGEIIRCDIERNIFFEFFWTGGPAGGSTAPFAAVQKSQQSPSLKEIINFSEPSKNTFA